MPHQQRNRKKVTRRTFLAGAGAAALFSFVPRSILGKTVEAPSPNNKLNIAVIGVGGRGRASVNALARENLVAFCDVDDERACGTYQDYPQVKRYADFRIMLEREQKNIDAVVVATPDHCHAAAALMALKMGKHVYCEKPLTHTVAEARTLAQAAQAAQVATQMGNQGHSNGGSRLLCEYVWAGAIGKVARVETWTDRPIWPQGMLVYPKPQPVPQSLCWDLWLGPMAGRPYSKEFLPFNWRGWWDFGTGALGDMGAHIMDMPYWALNLGYPTTIEAESEGGSAVSGPVSSTVSFTFPARGALPPVQLTWYDGGRKPERPKELGALQRMGTGSGGALLYGDNGIIMTGCYGEGTTLLPTEKMKENPRPPQVLPRSPGHHAEWVRACKGGEKSLSDFAYAARLTETMLLGNIALRLGRKLEYDGEKMRFKGDAEANALLQMPYRKGYEI